MSIGSWGLFEAATGKKILFSLVLICVYAESSAAGPCVAPEAPHAALTKPRTPRKPDCAPIMGGCDRNVVSQYDFETKKYQEEMKSYTDASNAYLNKLREYLVQAQEFARCEAQKL